MPALGDGCMSIAKAQQSSRQVVMGLGERNPQGERMPVRRQSAVVFVQIHQRVAELQTGSGVSGVECQSLLEASRCLTDLPLLGAEHAQRVGVIRAARLKNARAM